MTVTYEYPRPALTVDCVLFGPEDEELKVLLIHRKHAPYRGKWAFPGGFVDIDEPLEEAARRELEEETGLRNVLLEQLQAFGEVGRDPRGRVVSVTYYALVNLRNHRARAASDASEAAWVAVSQARDLAFDHDRILAVALARLREKVRRHPVGFDLLPSKFTMAQLYRLYESILGKPLDKRRFRRQVLRTGLLKALDQGKKGAPPRAARLYRLDRRRYRQLARSGFHLES